MTKAFRQAGWLVAVGLHERELTELEDGVLPVRLDVTQEVGSRNVRVNAVLPGVLRTPMTARLPEARLSELAEENLLGRLNSLGEVASFIVFLARMRDVSGQVFQLDSRIARWT